MDSLAADLEALRDQHARLEKQIAEEQQRKAPDQFRLQELKREKLHIKEQIVGV